MGYIAAGIYEIHERGVKIAIGIAFVVALIVFM